MNDTGGHPAGDRVLQAVSCRLRNVISLDDVAIRMGGDEFLVASRRVSTDEVTDLANRIVNMLSVPIMVGAVEYKVGASVGVAWQDDVNDVGQLLIDADLALYDAKKSGKGCAKVFREQLRVSATQLKTLGDEIQRGLLRGEFLPFFQPQFNANSLEIVGVEALARWDHPVKGILSPAHFLSVAEDLGCVAEIDKAILTRAIADLGTWGASGVDIPRISVNVSAQRLQQLADEAELVDIPFTTGRLCFEMLESISFETHCAAFCATIAKIRKLGIEIEIDDFGTGHASILSLLHLQPRRLKIDQQFVKPIVDSNSQRRHVASIIEIGRSQNIEIVAEGVETMEHVQILRDLGCHVLQGYALAKPMSSQMLANFARDRSRTSLPPAASVREKSLTCAE